MILNARCVSPGVAQGKAIVLDSEESLASAVSIPASLPPSGEIERFRAARGRAAAQLARVQRQLTARSRAQDAAIFASHASMLSDAKLTEQIEERISEARLSAEAAVAQVVLDWHQQFTRSRLAIVRDKASDILDLGRRLLECLTGSTEIEPVAGGIIVAAAITPSELVRFAHQGVRAVITQSCGGKSHTAILARGLGIPLVTGIDSATTVIPEDAEVVLDAAVGTVIVNPVDQEEEAAQSLRRQTATLAGQQQQQALEPITQDGVRVRVLLNISDLMEASAVAQLNADGVGLYRTEFFYLSRPWWPSETESYELYSRVAEEIGDRELCIRLADFGAEKSPAYADIAINRNPSLGIRGMRLLLGREDVLQPQMKAIERLARRRPVTLLLPMVDTTGMLMAATQKICQLCCCGTRDELPFRLGIMVEVPSAALLIEELIEHVDSVSVGLNDLTQYLLAADRDDELVEAYHDALQPVVLRLVRRIIEVADARRKTITMCGELAGNPMLAQVLLAMGARRFSVSRSHFHGTVSMIRNLSVHKLAPLAPELLQMVSGQAVREFLEKRF